jgi:hypothetical protein
MDTLSYRRDLLEEEIMISHKLEALRLLLADGNILKLCDQIERRTIVTAHKRNGHQHPDKVAPDMTVSVLNLITGNLILDQFLQQGQIKINILECFPD